MTESRPILLDGGMGRELQRRGLASVTGAWWCLSSQKQAFHIPPSLTPTSPPMHWTALRHARES